MKRDYSNNYQQKASGGFSGGREKRDGDARRVQEYSSPSSYIIQTDNKGQRSVESRAAAGGSAGGGTYKKISGWSFGEPGSSSINLPTRPASRDVAVDESREEFGVVVSLKDVFGFIQPFLKEEQLYFSLRDIGGEIVIGDMVRYRERPSAKGMHAELVRIVPGSSVKELEGEVVGTVIREPDTARKVPGIASVVSSTIIDPKFRNLPKQLSFSVGSTESAAWSNRGGAAATLSKKRIMKGDEVKFAIVHVPNTNFMHGRNASISRTRKEIQMASQVQRMLDAGASQEIGIVDTVKGDFGFIKPQNRKDQIYFKLSDLMDPDARIEQNMEVSFFVIMESSKGGMSDRAVHLQIIQSGTVQFETTLADSVLGTVVVEPIKNGSREIPGKIRLLQSLPYPTDFKPEARRSGDESGQVPTSFAEIELWARCVPETLILRVGDVIKVNVTHYRPEELLFARSVRVSSYRPLGREYGIIKSVRGQGYGFVTSTIRDYDLYFRTGDVVGESGLLMRDRDIDEGMTISYDVVAEESMRGANASSSGKLRGTRAMLIPDPNLIPTSVMVAECLEGIVQRDAKRDSIGVIRITSELSGIDIIGAACSPDITAALQQFESIPELKELSLEHLPPSQRKLYHRVLDVKFPHLCHESVDTTIREGNKLVSLKIWKPKNSTEIEEWTTKQGSMNRNQKIKSILAKASSAHFQKSDVNDKFGLLYKDLEVNFQLHLDFKTGNFIAKSVSLTDKPYTVPDAITASNISNCNRQVGVIQVISGTDVSMFGFIRVIPSCQKIFWHESGLSPEFKGLGATKANGVSSTGSSDEMVVEGLEVSFEMRLRGGLPCAVDVRMLPKGSLCEEEVVDGTALGVVVDDNKVVLLDLTACSILSRQYWNGKLVDESMQQKASPSVIENISEAISADEIAVTIAGPEGAESTEDASGVGDSACVDDSMDISFSNDASTTIRESTPIIANEKLVPKYFEMLVRTSLAATDRDVIVDGKGAAANIVSLGDMKPGDLVSCAVVVNWGLSRQPIAVCDVKPAVACQSIESINVRKSKGSIIKLRIKCNGSSFDSKAPSQAIELCEIKETSRGPWLRISAAADCDAPGGASFLCDVRDVVKLGSSSASSAQESPQHQQPLHLGDQVEFYAVSMDRGAALLALGGHVLSAPAVSSASANTEGISFRRSVNTTLKETLTKQGFKGIHMAQGPPDEGVNVGFKPDWRPQPDVSGLPWAHLLG